MSKKTPSYWESFLLRIKKDYYFVLFASVRRARVERCSFIPPIRLVWRLILNVRRVAILEWLRAFPVLVPRPVSWQVRLIMIL